MVEAGHPAPVRGHAGWSGQTVDDNGAPFLFLVWPEAGDAEWQEIVQGE